MNNPKISHFNRIEKKVNFTITDLKIISKGPVSQHFKECMMINIFAYIIQIVVLASCTNAFLAVSSTFEFRQITVWIHSSQKN